ncbi:MAG: DNRLRE domain-containing protein [Candidatus Polarisedimenticolia bacterium]
MIRFPHPPGAAVAAVCGVLAATAAYSEVVSIPALRDNTLYQSATGATSNGAGDHFFVGRTEVIAGGVIHRGLIAFNVAQAIPAGARVTRVELTLNMSRTIVGLKPVSLHRLLASWGEGTSDAAAQEGSGAPATTGDATWLHRFFNTVFWSAAGAAGDFVATPSTTVQIGAIGSYTLLSTPALVADVQGWLDDPSTSFGWILIGDESTLATSKRFDSRTNLIATARPRLTIEFSTGPGGAGAVPDGARTPGTPLTVALAAGGGITLQWGASCLTTDTDFAIYAGAVPDFRSYAPRFCTTGGATTMTFTPGAGSEFYLVVPRNASQEGSYGADGTGADRPPSATACLVQAVSACP